MKTLHEQIGLGTQDLRESSILGRRTLHRAITAAPESQEWLEGAPVCPALSEYAILHLGVVDAVQPYRFVRPSIPVTEFLACVSGEGLVYIDGRWVNCGAGEAVLLPMHAATAYQAAGTEPWRLVWVCYMDREICSAALPVIKPYEPLSLYHSVEALRQEALLDCDPACMRTLIGTIQRLVLRFAQSSAQDPRLASLWQKVSRNLAAEWTLETLAAEARCSREHLRRLCQEEIGRSPMQQVTHLRLQHAAELLAWADYKVEYIAAVVGYQNPYAFSATFKKWSGCPPTEYRLRSSAVHSG